MTSSSRIIAIIQARLDSSRLPGKALKTYQGIPLIGYVLARAKRIQGANEIVLATTERAIDDPLCDYAVSQSVQVFRGDCLDVAGRMLQCARTYQGDYFIRINGDSPFLDFQLIQEGIARCQQGKYDFVTNLVGRTFPYGIAVEIVRTKAFEEIYPRLDSQEKEHLTKYLYAHPHEFYFYEMQSACPEYHGARLVVDTLEDWDIFTQMVQHLADQVSQAGYCQTASLYARLTGKPVRTALTE